MSSLGEFLAASNLLPHGHCLFWRPDLLLLHVVSDVLIALAYFSIPLALLELLRRRKDLVFNQVFLMFAAFITACGLTHVFNVADVWFAMYPLSGLMKAFTAFISLVTAVACWRLLPAAVALPSPQQLRDEVELRKAAETELREHNISLEQAVSERTAELTALNQQLQREIEHRSQLQKRAEFLAAVFDWSGDAIKRMDRNGIVQAWNHGAQKLYGYSEAEMIGQPIARLFAPEAAQPDELIAQIKQTGEAISVEAPRITKSGELIHVLLTLSPIKDSHSDEIIGYAGISRSIEARIQAEQKLINTAENLQAANAELKDFVYIASHDLQEPLRLITSYLNIIAEDYGDKLDDDARRYINYTLESGQRLQQLITDLLAYSRLNTAPKEPTRINTRKVIDDALSDLKLMVDEKQARIEVSEQLPTVYGDASQLRMVFSNLINNALKYSREDEPPIISISASRNEQETQFEIKDNGIGFEPKQTERIFQVFRRLHARHHYSGTGIGLSICKKVVERHGGKIWAESKPNVGSRFYFTIMHTTPQHSSTDKNGPSA